MIFAIFNSAFLVRSPAFNEISLVEGGALRSVMIFLKLVKNIFQL